MSLAAMIILLAMVAALVTGTRQKRSWGGRLLERVDVLEERIDRLAVGGGTGRNDYQADELHRLEERIDFLERLLEERPKRRSLPRDEN